ncbi:MAG: GMC family oxidoreductase N-terminal domain-containing protein [Rhodospirillum sp.]|nr:GMC family oxidoreductase N-terminal domain-containing protein [Rhodospirillum sp.]MCF8490115.1 GMC family oxidoreductase N-terminal domain-containing protein [Rhodospirillum sp.]
MSEEFDYIVVGAGSAGCVMANRLSENGKYTVAVVEAGGMDNWIWFHIPVGYLFAIGNPRADWCFKTEADPGLNGRVLGYPRGKVIGGSSAINAMLYLRGQARDYDQWRQLGLEGWGWDDVLPLFIKHENSHRGTTPFHGAGGEWTVETKRASWEVLDSFIDAADQAGIPRTEDFNTGDNGGCGYFEVNQKTGRRWSAARGFLKPALKRPNLTLITGALTDKVVLEGKRATGIVLRRDGRVATLKARKEVILSAGAVASPAILERSGIGDGERLRVLGVVPLHHLPGVGENLQDHLQLRLIYKVHGVETMNVVYQSLLRRARMGIEYALFRRGPLTMAPSQLGAFARTDPRHVTPNAEFHIQPLSLEKFGEPMHSFGAITVSICNLRPSSRGGVHTRSRDPNDAPIIAPNYLSHTEDQVVATEAIRLARKVMGQEAMSRFLPEEYKPGAHLTSDGELVTAAGDIGTTIFHPVGTAKMGADSDPMAVTDARLRVRGVAGLRVIDASVMPTITSGNTNSPTIMIAEKGAGMVLEDANA